jgi:hypothetical protein
VTEKENEMQVAGIRALGGPVEVLDVYWRNRIAKSERPHRVSGAVRRVAEQTGVLKGRRRRAADSTILADGVATQDTVTQLVSAIRRVAREVPGAAEQIAVVCTGHDYSKPGKPKIDWDDPQAKDIFARAKGKLKGKPPMLTARQQARLVQLHTAGDDTISDLGEVFSVSRAPVSAGAGGHGLVPASSPRIPLEVERHHCGRRG